MNIQKITYVIKRQLPIYILIAIIALVIRYFCKINDSNALKWILLPTARWVSVLSGIPFEYLPHMGYVNHFHQFLIAPSCSGIRFMLLTFIMLTISFIYKVESNAKTVLWFIFSMAFSYLSTIFVNGFRIILSIKLPITLDDMGLMNGWLNPDRLHTIIGSSIYFLSLCIIYMLASFICNSVFLNNSEYPFLSLLIPAFWYLTIVLILPFLKRIYYNEWKGFTQYALLILTICCIIISILHIIRMLHHFIYLHKNNN